MSVSSSSTLKYKLTSAIVQKPIRNMSQQAIEQILKHNKLAKEYKVNDNIEGHFDADGDFIINDGTSISGDIIRTNFKLVNTANTTQSEPSSVGGAVKSKRRMRRRTKRIKKTKGRRPRNRRL
jgi:hypothetical protein